MKPSLPVLALYELKLLPYTTVTSSSFCCEKSLCDSYLVRSCSARVHVMRAIAMLCNRICHADLSSASTGQAINVTTRIYTLDSLNESTCR